MSKYEEPYYKEIVKKFGQEILLENKEINRPKLAQIIFNNNKKREELNKITCKYIAKEIEEQAKEEGQNLTIIDAPLLIETKLNQICDIVIAVIANENIKISRICERDNVDEETAKQRLSSQLAEEIYIKNSNYVLINDNANLEEEVEKFLELLNNKKL